MVPPFSAISFCRIRIAIVGRGLEIAAECRFRVGDDGGEIELAVVADRNGLSLAMNSANSETTNRTRKIQNDQ